MSNAVTDFAVWTRSGHRRCGYLVRAPQGVGNTIRDAALLHVERWQSSAAVLP